MHVRLTVVLAIVLMGVSIGAPAKAASSSIMISEVQTGAVGNATHEFIELVNTSPVAVDVTGWKVQYLSAAGTSPGDIVDLEGVMQPGGKVLLSSQTGSANTAPVPYIESSDFYFSAGLAASGGHIIIKSPQQQWPVDMFGWGSAKYMGFSYSAMAAVAPKAGESLVRKTVSESPFHFVDTDDDSADFKISALPTPEGGAIADVEHPSLEEIVYLHIIITELLPNPAAPLSDAEAEFIELFNPNDQPVNLKGYILQTGMQYQYSYTLPDIEIEPQQYMVLPASMTRLTLANTSSQARLIFPNDEISSETAPYTAIGEGQAWALVSEQWLATDELTPAASNKLTILTDEIETLKQPAASTVAPCPEGKYRNPETNRCRTIETAVATLAPCDEDQERNPVTNRCRNVATVASARITPCPAGYERNQQTNRCRKLAADESGLKPCDPGQERNPKTNRCRKIAVTTPATTVASVADGASRETIALPGRLSWWVTGAIVGGVISYGIYEWRYEWMLAIRKIREKVSRS